MITTRMAKADPKVIFAKLSYVIRIARWARTDGVVKTY